jgi:Pentapeptide repeats (8 copies)
MTNPTTNKSQRVRFEEVTPTNEIVAYFSAQLPSLLAGTELPIFPGYDDLDYIQFAYITLPSGNTVVLGQYENAPEIGVDLYVELEREAHQQGGRRHSSNAIFNIAILVVETLRYLAIPRATAIWFHPDYETEIERLYAEQDGIESIARYALAPPSSRNIVHEPIDCFYYALEIYTRPKFPEHWAMLQHNLGLAYYNRRKWERWKNLQDSIECFNNSLEVFDRDKYPQKWQINQEDLKQSQEAWQIEKLNLSNANLRGARLTHTDLSNANLKGAKLSSASLSNANLSDADLRGAILMYVNLSNANLSNANLNDADLRGANLSSANLSSANLSDANLILANFSNANLSGANVDKAQFRHNEGISESMRQDLMARGAIFDDAPDDRSEAKTLVPR